MIQAEAEALSNLRERNARLEQENATLRAASADLHAIAVRERDEARAIARWYRAMHRDCQQQTRVGPWTGRGIAERRCLECIAFDALPWAKDDPNA